MVRKTSENFRLLVQTLPQVSVCKIEKPKKKTGLKLINHLKKKNIHMWIHIQHSLHTFKLYTGKVSLVFTSLVSRICQGVANWSPGLCDWGLNLSVFFQKQRLCHPGRCLQVLPAFPNLKSWLYLWPWYFLFIILSLYVL